MIRTLDMHFIQVLNDIDKRTMCDAVDIDQLGRTAEEKAQQPVSRIAHASYIAVAWGADIKSIWSRGFLGLHSRMARMSICAL